jgi:GT2 family glycosyltransferase
VKAVPNLITIVIPNLNGKEMLRNCLRSIWQQSFRDFHVIIVDNGSSDDSVKFIETHYPQAEVVKFERNRGFSEAINAGIKRSKSKLVCLLNNDTELDPSFLEQIVIADRSRSDADYYAPKMLSYHAREILDGAGDGFLRGGIGYRIGTLERDGALFSKPRMVFGACAGAAVYKREIFETIGYFDDDFFAYLEDLDINLRAARHGYNCLFVPTAQVYHIGSATTGTKFNAFIVSRTTKNIVNVLVKNFQTGELLRALPVIIIHHLTWIMVILRKGQFPAYLKGVGMAIDDFPKMRVKRKSIISECSHLSSFHQRVHNAEKEVLHAIARRREVAGKATWPVKIYLKFFK